jgi:hypothetical protein
MKKVFSFVAGLILLSVSGANAQTITDFYATPAPSTIPCGGSATLWWNTTGATSVSLVGGALSMTLLPTSGSTSVSGLTATTMYVLTAHNGSMSTTQSLTLTVLVNHDTVAGSVSAKTVLVKDIEYSFITLDTLYLIDSGKVIVRDSAVVTITGIDTVKSTSNRLYRRNTCSGDTVNQWTINTVYDTVRGPVTFDTVHFQTIRIIPVGIEDVVSEGKQNGIHVFPNPSHGAFSISQSGKWTACIVDISGKTVHVLQGNDTTQVNTDLAPGMYILSLQSDAGVYAQRIIIQ